MLSSVFEVMNSINPELSWKSVTKGRRSKKSVARSLSSAVKVGNSTSPHRVGDFFMSNSDKFGEVIFGQETSAKLEHVPLKKRRHSLQSASPYPWASSLCNQDSVPSSHLQLQHPSFSSGDFSGIELLAAAATMDVDIGDADKKDISPVDSSIQKSSDASSSATLSKQCLKNNESVKSLSNIDDLQENNFAPSRSLSASPEDETVSKVDRKYWDLNTSMDAWDESYDDSITGDTSKHANECRRMEKHGDHVLSNATGPRDGSSSPKIEQDKSTSAAVYGIYSKPLLLKERLQQPPDSIYSHSGRDTSKHARETDSDYKNSIQALTSYADLKNLDQVIGSDATVGSSPSSKLCSSSGMLKSGEKNNVISATVAMKQDGDCSSNTNECVTVAALGDSHIGTAKVNAHDIAASESAIDVQPGVFTLDVQPVASTDSNKQIDRAFLSNSTMADCEQYLELDGTNLDKDSNLRKEESTKTILVDTCNSTALEQHDKPTTTVGRIGPVIDGRRRADISQDNHHLNMVDGDDLTGFQEGYDSPYEDGELRGSFLYSWEENECVDYESDGRNGDGSDAADYLGSEIVEGGSDGSNGTQRSLSQKISSDGKCKNGQVKHYLKKHFVKDESDNNVIAGKVSNAGSGSTVEECVEMPMEENDAMKRLQLSKVRADLIDEYASKSVKGKLHSPIEGWSSADGIDGKDGYFMQQSRPRYISGSSYPRLQRDISPDRLMGKYRFSAPGERDGVHKWTSWGSNRCYTTNYRCEGPKNTRIRSKAGEPANKIDGVEYHERRQTNYLSKDLHRPLMRRSPMERDEYFGVGRRLPLTRGVGKYRGRGNYTQRPSTDFVEDFEPLSNDAVRMPHYLSKTEHSFLPSSGRKTQMPLPRRRSRSRSRTRSQPRAWQHSHRERIVGGRRLSRSPDYRLEARMERMRVPFSKPTFASGYEEGGYTPHARGRFSPPQRSCRWFDDRDFVDNHIRRRRSPVFRRTQRFDGRLKPDEHFRPNKFSFMANSGRECKIESNYDDRRRGDDDSSEMNNRVL